ncbi:oligosaccharide flippase family protein [Shewanella sp. SG44-6]|uniref:oligosaccharide flippase family protein n=1 Tax=Shewanella sp. SG44-6 TaxID=2760959 RepID=UPI001600EEA2|nr:oligosaccharide flippase family protein [Shewanella sp. SG44-6]MBB1392038.1 oligosaccharide flippase family protein [Shewanella sp. SG44-6]
MIKNVLYMVLSLFFNYLSPLILFPLFTETFEVKDYSNILLYLGVIQLGYLISEFGFNISVSKKIIANTSLTKHVSVPVIFIKFFVSTIYVLSIIFIFNINLLVAILLFVTVFFQTIQFNWIYTAEENFKKISLISIIVRTVYLILSIIVVLYSPSVINILFCLAISQVIGFAVSLSDNIKNILTNKLDFNLIKDELKDAIPFFISRVTSFSQYYLIVPLSALTSTPQLLANIGNADVLFKAGKGIFGSLIQVSYPYFNKNKNVRLFILTLTISTIFLIFSCIILSFFTSDIIVFIFGEKYVGSAFILNNLFFLAILNFISGMLGYPFFSLIDRVDVVNKTSYFSFCCFSIMLCLCYYLYFVDIYTIIIILAITELVLILSRVYFYFLSIKHKLS